MKSLQFKKLQWTDLTIRMDNSRIMKKKYWMKNSMEEDLWGDHNTNGKTTTEVLLVAVERKRMEGTNRGCLQANYCRRQGSIAQGRHGLIIIIIIIIIIIRWFKRSTRKKRPVTRDIHNNNNNNNNDNPISQFAASAGKYSPILGCNNQQD